MQEFDVTALGEILIDMTYAGKSENGQVLFEQNPGGAPANVLSAVAKLGGKTAFIGKIGNDMHGAFLRETLKKHGICDKNLITTDEAFTTLAFVSLSETGERTFSFARKPGADTTLSADDVDFDIIKNSCIFHIGSLSLTDEPSRTATLKSLETAKENGVIISYDPNYRALLWESVDKAKEGMRLPLPFVDIIKISDEELELVTDEKTPEKAIEALLGKGISCVMVTMGEKGSVIGTKAGSLKIEAAKCEKVVDTTGAGDSFMGGFLYNLIKDKKHPSELTLEDIEKYGNFAGKVAAYCVGKRGAIDAMPALDEIK